MPTENKPADPKPTGLSQGWNLTRKNDGFVVGHQSVAYPPDEKAIERAERDGYVWVPFLVPAAQPQGEPVAHMPVERCYDVRAKMIIAFNEAKKAGGDLDDALDAAYKSALRYSPNPMNAEQPDRSPESYAIEHAEYMAKSADDVLAKFQTYGLALLAVDEGGDDGEGELFENIDSARGDLQESLVDLRSMVYEFRKRSAKSR